MPAYCQNFEDIQDRMESLYSPIFMKSVRETYLFLCFKKKNLKIIFLKLKLFFSVLDYFDALI